MHSYSQVCSLSTKTPGTSEIVHTAHKCRWRKNTIAEFVKLIMGKTEDIRDNQPNGCSVEISISLYLKIVMVAKINILLTILSILFINMTVFIENSNHR